MFQMKEQGEKKIPEEELIELEISNLPNKAFLAIILKMLK